MPGQDENAPARPAQATTAPEAANGRNRAALDAGGRLRPSLNGALDMDAMNEKAQDMAAFVHGRAGRLDGGR